MPVWINEFHYDNNGTDANEFIEVAGTAGTDLTGWTIVLYNGSGGASYATLNLGGTLANTSNGFGFQSVLATGLQNGAPDGLALVNNLGVVVQFLSYEGVFTATNGPASGMTSTDVGVSQDGINVPAGSSLHLVGTGDEYSDFTWAATATNSAGVANSGQTFIAPLPTLSVTDVSILEGDAGTTTFAFTVSLSAAAGAGGVTFDIATADGTAQDGNP
jgi:hypothetical protein